MSSLEIPTCAWCGEPIAQTNRRGPKPRHCNANCRVAAHRARRATAALAAEFEPELRASATPTSAPPVDEQVARALLEARGLVGTLTRLGLEARPQFAWRCTRIAQALAAVLRETIGEE